MFREPKASRQITDEERTKLTEDAQRYIADTVLQAEYA